ncbi:MAG TPA: hypothetical protein VL443_24225 [Cyclobacteriaceae bacterium]|jgi:hypothetical protein|nr:hypothetical protein [Cyclobacteriaceae bacterium]
MSYFDHHYVSNSDLKKLHHKLAGRVDQPNLQEIYDAGTLNHNALLEPYKCDKTHPGYPLAKTMAETVLRDELCRKIIMHHDFRREHEWYRSNRWGLKGVRCKTDGDSKELSTIFEYKGLAITTEKAFDAAILHHDYDASCYYYLNVVGYKYYLIAGVSKEKPKMLFKRLYTRDHDVYSSGGIKIETEISEWKNFGFV